MEDEMQDEPVFDMKGFPIMDISHGYIRSHSNKASSTSAQDYNYLSARDEIDSITRELTELHENLLKMSVRAHILEVDLATQFNPDTILDIKQVDMACQKCSQAVEKTTLKSYPAELENCTENDMAPANDDKLREEKAGIECQ